MKLEKNGRASAGQKLWHIHIRYFFIKARIKKGEINLIYCNTKNMIVDYFTKPLQGALFQRFRDIIMGYTHPSLLESSLAPLQERVVHEIQKGIWTNHDQQKDTLGVTLWKKESMGRWACLKKIKK